ncbi:MAG: DUF3426 domain-containing protein [Pseudomonadota bacterium]
MTHLVTRCPKCATAFRLTSNQLESARGSVRCGSCLHIFKAQEHLADNNPVATNKQTPAAKVAANPKAATGTKSAENTKPTQSNVKRTSAPAAINRAKVFEDEDDTLISDDMDKSTEKESAYEFDGFLEVNLQPKQNASLFDREIRYDSQIEKEHVDESWADNLLDSEDSAQKLAKAQAKSAEGNQAPKSPPTKPQASTKKAQTSGNDQHINNHKTPVFSFVNETNTSTEGSEFSDAFIHATQAKEPDNASIDDTSNLFAAGLFNEEEFDTTQTTKRHSKNSAKMQAVNPSRAALLMNIIPAPIEFTAKRMRNWYQQQLWLSLALLAAITLIFQIAYFKFNYFSRVEPYRSVYAIACPILHCKVPSLVDITQISATNLVVRVHPQAENALMVDAIILNKAPFDQPFPDLKLAFSTVDDIPVTARRFSAKEYLGGELAGMKYIPRNQPVHITLELVDPGPDAVNYHMSIAP